MKGAGSWRPLRTNLEKEGLGPQVLAVTLLAAGGGRNSSQCEETWVVQQDTHQNVIDFGVSITMQQGSVLFWRMKCSLRRSKMVF